MCTFYTKDVIFLPGASRVLPAFGEACVKFTTRRGGDFMSLLSLSCASIQDEGATVVLAHLPPLCCMHSHHHLHVWTRVCPRGGQLFIT